MRELLLEAFLALVERRHVALVAKLRNLHQAMDSARFTQRDRVVKAIPTG